MSQSDATPTNERVERLLDGLSHGPGRDDALVTLRAEGLGEAVELHDKIEASLRRRFPVASPTPRQVEEFAVAVGRGPGLGAWRRWGIAGWTAAALLLIALSLAQRGPKSVSPFFEPAPLVALYRETVEQGFEPYYECEDPDRFAAVFAKRQGLPLQLESMPSGSRMLGLSYPGGLSRDTTAMLCEVDGQPVMVFVDRLDADRQAAAITAEAEGLHVLRSVLAGLVVYEVTPLAGPRAAPYLAVGSSR